jgi:hypothetical protein
LRNDWLVFSRGTLDTTIARLGDATTAATDDEPDEEGAE